MTRDGKIPRRIADHLRDWLLMHAGRVVQIRLRQAPRSLASNRYYWGVVIATVRRGLKEAGIDVTAEQVHESFKGKYLEPRAEDGRTLPPSTATLDAYQFHRYVESIRHDESVLALGVHIPEPNNVNGHRIFEIERGHHESRETQRG